MQISLQIDITISIKPPKKSNNTLNTLIKPLHVCTNILKMLSNGDVIIKKASNIFELNILIYKYFIKSILT